MDFSVESRKSTRDILVTLKIESRIEINAASVSRSAIEVLISKHDAMVDIKALTEIGGELA